MMVSFGNRLRNAALTERQQGEPWASAPPVSTSLLVPRHVLALMLMEFATGLLKSF
jgi:hypothetical protein